MLLFVFIATGIALNTAAQTNILKKKRTYKIEGYVLLGPDTINGTIAIPITYDELDYNSLATSVTFIDSLNNTKKYTPLKASGFGLRDDAVFGDYVSIRVEEDFGQTLFLKKVLNGKITLFEHNLDRTVVRDRSPGSNIQEKVSIDESIYYLRKGDEPLVKIQFNSKTSTIRKKDLKKLINILPDNFVNSDEEINATELLTILSDYNLTGSKE